MITMSKILKHILLIIVCIFSLVVITINLDSLEDIYRTRRDFIISNNILEDCNLAVDKYANLSYESYDPLQFATFVNSSDNLPCATIAGYYYRTELSKLSENSIKKYTRRIPEWNFFINVYETNLAIDSAESYFSGVIKGVAESIGNVDSIRHSIYETYPTLQHSNIVDNEPANTIIIFTNNFAYHITAIDSTEDNELDTLLSHLSFDIPPAISILPWKLIALIILLHICLLVELLICVINLKRIGRDNKVARGFAIFTFVMICAYLIASIVHSTLAIFDVWYFYQDEYISGIWIYSGLVFFLSALFGKLLIESNLQTGVGFILPKRWKTRLKDNKMSRVIVILICYPCLITLTMAGFLAIPFVLIVYILFLLMYVITNAVKWIISGSIS